MKRGSRHLHLVTLSLTVAYIWLASSSPTNGDEPANIRTPPSWAPIPQTGVIESSGTYYLQQDLEVARSTGIDVKADHVTIDLCGHALHFTGIPREGTYGIVANDRTGVTISNGTVRGFWFNIHCTNNQQLRIRNIAFDDIPYLAVNVAQSRDISITDNVFSNFRYDLPKDEDSTYVVGVNIGAEDVVISNNRFIAEPKLGPGNEVQVETVFVLFSANVSKNCVVAHNDLAASYVLPRSYGVWIATNADATIAQNRVHNMKYGVCLGADAATLVCGNQFVADDASTATTPIETIGVQAAGAKKFVAIDNTFDGVKIPTVAPERKSAESAGGS